MTFTNQNSRLGKKYPPELIRPEKLRQMVDECSRTKKAGRPSRGITHKRDKALIVVLWRSGLRIAEALALEPKDLDMTGCTITVRNGKGDKFGVVGMDAMTKEILQDWIKARRTLEPADGSPLFCTLNNGGTILQSAVRRMLAKRAKRAGIEQRLVPHSLRHALARELAVEGKDLFQIQQALRHDNPATTARYLATLANDLGVSAIQGRGDEPMINQEVAALRAIVASVAPERLAELENAA